MNGIILYITIFFLILAIKSYEDKESLLKRVEYYKKIKEFSNNTLDFTFEYNKGIYIVSNDNIVSGQKTLKVPRQYSMCPYYLFPFKYELIESLKNVYDLEKTIGMDQKFGLYILTYYIMYENFANKEKIREYILENKLEEYYDIDKINPNIKNSFPRIMLTQANMNTNHFKLISDLRYGTHQFNEVELIFVKVILNLNLNPHYKMIFPWIFSKENFYWAYSIASTRGMSIRFNDYLILDDFNNKKLNQFQQKNLEINKIVAQNTGAPCIISFLDISNHYQPKFDDLRDKRPLFIDTQKGYFENTASYDITYGGDVSYTYNKEPNNFFLYFNYGFFYRDNIFNSVSVELDEPKFNDNERIKLCKLIDCGNIANSELKYMIKINKVNDSLLNYLRVKYLKDNFDSKIISKLLINKKIISLENEIKSWMNYYNLINNIIVKEKIDLNDSIRKAQKYSYITKKLEEEGLDNNISKWIDIKHHENIYKIDISYKKIPYRQMKLSINHIINYVYEEINEIKNLYNN